MSANNYVHILYNYIYIIHTCRNNDSSTNHCSLVLKAFLALHREY